MATAAHEKLLEESIARLQADVFEGEPIDLKNFTRDQLQRLVIEGYGEKKFRADQIWGWMYTRLARSFDEMTNLSKALRGRLAATARVCAIDPQGNHPADDGTTKLTYELDDEAVVESVFIPFETHNALCISSQVGCAMGCDFCASTRGGLERNLDADEIVEQVVEARRLAAEAGTTQITNIVFMGMGEPLHNLDAVIQACEILTDQDGLDFSRRRVTVSTSGLVPAIERFMAESNCQLAVSLNATTDVQRSQIMPVNDRWNIEALLDCLRNLDLERRQRITLEYVLLGEYNDTLADAERLVELTRGIPCKVNLIPFNPHPETPFKTPTEAQIDRFKQYLVDRNVSVFRRKTRGRDEMAACGQLGKPSGKVPAHLRKRLAQLQEQLA
jgi:23S rRNA (adenine2503-C2)-methyltransferase